MSDDVHDEDATLLARVAGGDLGSPLEELYDRYAGRLNDIYSAPPVLKRKETSQPLSGPLALLDAVFAQGRKGLTLQRYKGLGEMNAEQLWETTLDPNARTLLRVTLEEAAEAERMFSVLMGEDVERRRQFIEEHALEVKNLDV